MKIIIIYFFLFAFWITNTIGFSTGVKGLSIANLSFYFFILAWAFNSVFKRKLFEWNSVNTYLMLLIFVVILSLPYKILLDEMPYVSVKADIINIKKWIEPFFIFFILFNILDDKKTCEKSFLGLGILLLISALSGPLTSLNIIKIGRATAFGRATGFSGDTNEFAAYLVLLMPLVLTFSLFHKSKTLKTYGAITLFATFFALIFAGSRGGFLSCAASMFGYLFMLYNQKLIRLHALFSIAVIILMVGTISFVFAPSGVKKMISNRADPTKYDSVEHFSTGRFRIWRNNIKLFLDKPIFGHGKKTTAKLADIRYSHEAVTHNEYMRYLVEHGIIGGTIFILIFLKIFLIIWNYLKTTPDLWDKKLYISYMAGLVGYNFSMLFVNITFPRPIFWFYTAVILRYGQLQEIDKE